MATFVMVGPEHARRRVKIPQDTVNEGPDAVAAFVAALNEPHATPLEAAHAVEDTFIGGGDA